MSRLSPLRPPVGVVALLALSLASCSREPRSAAYFETHRDDAAAVVASCRQGTHRGQECVNAQAADPAAAREARMKLYRKQF